MKLKFSYIPQKSVWFKRIVSKGLILGLFFNNISYSFANIKNSNERYENFEGNDITINNVLEEDKVDVEIEGNTLVNLASNYFNHGYYERNVDNTVNILGWDTSLHGNPNLNKIDILKRDTTYTLFLNKPLRVIVRDNYIESEEMIDLHDSFTDKVVFKTTNEINTYTYIKLLGAMKEADAVYPVNNVEIILLEGDWSNKETPNYFEGIKSVGEKDSINEINIISNNRNLFDINNATNQFIRPEGNTLSNADYENKTSDFIKIEPNTFYIYNVENFTDTNGLWTGYAFYSEKDMNSVIDSRITIYSLNNVIIKTPENAKYIKIGSRYLQQEGVKVFLQKLNYNYNINNKNLFDINSATNHYIASGGANLSNADYENKTSDFIEIESNTLYMYNVKNFTNTNGLWTGYAFYSEKNMNSVINDRIVQASLTNVVIKTPENAKYLRIGSRYLQQEGINAELQKVANLNSLEYEEFTQDIKNIKLSEPLRALPNGIKDKIIKKDGQWVIERNCKKVILDGTEEWVNASISPNNIFETSIPDIARYNNVGQVLCNKFPYGYTNLEIWNTYDGIVNLEQRKVLCIRNSNTHTIQDLKEWLNNNPLTVIYQLAEPIYEPIKDNLAIKLFEETTYISNDSNITANMKVTVDRTINRAKEAIEIAEINPTVDNISIARMWINLMKESSNKDIFNNQINNITEITDLTIDKKTTTSNMDVYIKSQNGLSMTLSTNSIIFDEFDSTEDMEKLNAVNLTINSSLPYQLNSYMMTELTNKDGSNIIPKELFNLRLNGETDYKAFNNINEKLVLKENCQKGNNNQFNIDLILKGSLAHKADVYKTTLKFEAEQK